MSLWPLIMVAAAAASSAPTLSSSNYTLGRTLGGGQSIVLTGTNLTGATNVAIVGGGTTNVTPSASTATTCTFALPAHAAGVVTLAVTTPGGTSNTISFEFWSPLQMTGIDSFFDAEAGITQSGGLVTAWADQNAVRNVSQASVPNQPAYTANAFGTLHGITFTQGASVLGAASARAFTTGISEFVVYKSTNSRTPSTYAGDPPNVMVGDTSGGVNFNFGLSTNAVQADTYDSGWSPVTSANVSANDGNPHMVGFTFASTGGPPMALNLYKGSTNITSATRNYANLANPEWNAIGGGFDLTDSFGGTIFAVVTIQGVAAGGDITKLWAWTQQSTGAT